MQVFDDEFADSFDFDVLDPTKLIPEEVLPVQVIARLTLDRVVENVFCRDRQAAFCTQNIVPGVDFSNDPLPRTATSPISTPAQAARLDELHAVAGQRAAARSRTSSATGTCEIVAAERARELQAELLHR